MQLLINDSIKVSALQNAFSDMFPFLRLVFYSRIRDKNSKSLNPVITETEINLEKCRTIHNSGVVEITPDTTVNELVQCLNNQYGLSVEVMRQSGNAWLETTVTKTWTLEEQNEQGKSLSQHIDD